MLERLSAKLKTADGDFLCFFHATQRPQADGIEIAVDEYGGECDMRRYWSCVDCDKQSRTPR